MGRFKFWVQWTVESGQLTIKCRMYNVECKMKVSPYGNEFYIYIF